MSDRDDDRQSLFSSGSRDTTFISPRSGVSRTFLPGDIIGGSYQLLGLLGRGGMGLVFSCRHLTLGQDYALKLLDGNDVTDEHWKRFRTEAMALARLNHVGIVSIYNMGIDAGQWPYYVMELLSGETMASLIEAEGRLPVNEALVYFIQLADALYCAHQQGIIHRDIKPSNIMLLREGGRRISRVKLVDFGIARLSKTVFANQSQTATGLVFGTPFYMSPEQCQGLKVDERSDVYSFGCTFFEALTGEVPFAGSTSVEIFMQHLSHPQPSLASKGKTAFPPALELAVAKMLSKAPADRYENMEQIKYDLERILQGKEIRIQDGSRASLNSAVRAGETAAASSRSLSGRLPGQAGGRLSQKARNKSKASKVPLIVVSTLASIIAIVGLFALYRHLLVNDLPVETKHAGKSATPLWDLDDVGKPKYLAAADTGKANDKVGRSPVDDGGTSASVDALQDFGEDYDQTTIMVSKGINKFIRDEKEWKLRFADYSNDRKRLLSKFRPIGSENLVFPDNFSFGQISIDGASPRPAMGQFRCPRGAEVYWHGDCMTRTFNQVMYKWNADDLTGLDVVFTRPRPVIEMLSKWSRLRDLCFFNTLSKAMTPELDESRLTNEDLPLLEHFPKLRSLGLCDADLSGLAIAKMPLLHRLEGLKLKRIARIDAVLAVLPQLDNIKELWLVDVKTKDEDIDVLARMKNLENLRIRRGKLTAKSLAKFVKMPKLKHLYLDCTLSPEEKADFKAAMPYCEFEPVIDVTYWQMLPEK